VWLCHSLPAAALISSRGSKLSEHLGQQFYIENIAGAGGNIGTGQAARARPDGYTVLFAYGSFVVNPSIYAKTPYDPQKDFAPVTLAVVAPTVLASSQPGGAGNERQGPRCPHQSQSGKIQLRCFRGQDSAIDVATPNPEFDAWRWVQPPELSTLAVSFKRRLYLSVLAEFPTIFRD
jgi:hypothetical protein